jgi:xanthosine utilization system XapX-like protein
MMNKRAVVWLDQWAEIYALFLLIAGFCIALIADSSVVNYIVILLCGIVVGRLYAMRRARIGAPFYIMVIGFLIGYLVGAWLIRHRGNPIALMVIFFIGCYFGNHWYKHAVIK